MKRWWVIDVSAGCHHLIKKSQEGAKTITSYGMKNIWNELHGDVWTSFLLLDLFLQIVQRVSCQLLFWWVPIIYWFLPVFFIYIFTELICLRPSTCWMHFPYTNAADMQYLPVSQTSDPQIEKMWLGNCICPREKPGKPGRTEAHCTLRIPAHGWWFNLCFN